MLKPQKIDSIGIILKKSKINWRKKEEKNILNTTEKNVYAVIINTPVKLLSFCNNQINTDNT